MSKPITAVAVALLADDGKLSFDDPVEKYLREFGDLWVAEEQTAERRVLGRRRDPQVCAICSRTPAVSASIA
jgi:CubicO group peptidase (beta-lactamase class C family)